jgi:tetratricopeptide (TPR) repeat protein
MKYIGNTFFLVFFSTLFCFGQSSKIDSLQMSLAKSLNDSSKVRILNSLGIEFRKVEPEQSLKYLNEGLLLSEKLNYLKGQGTSLYEIGALYNSQKNYNKAIDFYTKSLKVREAAQDNKGCAISLNAIATAYIIQVNYNKALEFYLKSSAKFESIGDRESMPLNNIAACYYFLAEYENALNYYIKAVENFEKLGNKEKIINPTLGIGNVYNAMKNYSNALIYYKKAFAISKEINSKSRLSLSLNNIGNVYKELGVYDTALIYYINALKINEELMDKPPIALSLMNIGNVYTKTRDFIKALDYYQKALLLYGEIGNKDGCAKSSINIGILYSDLGDLEKACEYLKNGLVMADLINSKEILMEGNEELSEIYFKKGDYKNAYNCYREYTSLKDSILNETNTKNIAEIETKYETDKKEKEIESLTKDKRIKEEQLKNQETLRNAFVIGFVLLLVVVVLAYNRYRIKQKASKEIAEKNKEITESISYAKRIQSSFLTSEKYISQRLSDYFIFYMPRNIVSGDFYWLMEKNNNLYICTADCTGHGIPGAFMSLISMGILNEIIYSKTHITHTDDILNELRRIIILAVNPEGSLEEGKDGMDAVLCRFDFQKMELEYSAANNSFFIIRDGELLVFKPDKMPVGKYIGIEKPFTRNVVSLKKGDCIYTFSDGYADQFGGPENRKFQSKRLKELLLNHCHKPMRVQKEIFASTIKEWQGSNEQVDDILMMGIRI